MAYHNELLQQANELVDKNLENPTQADLRRAAVQHWSLEASRNGLSRMFEHRVMTRASERLLDTKQFPFDGVDPKVVGQLREVARAFSQLQERRHIADYDNSIYWTFTDALKEVRVAIRAFYAWQSIKHEKIAQDYLVSLLIRPRN